MHLGSLARLFRLTSFRREGLTQRRLQRHRSLRRVQAISTVNGVIQVPDPLGRDFADISMGSGRSLHDEVTKKDQKKIRKALDRTIKQERKEARKLQKLARKCDRSSRTRGSSTSSQISLLSVTVSDCNGTSDQEILAEIWATRPSSLGHDKLPEIDAELVDETRPTEFLFFTGCPDDKNLRELDVGYRRLRSNPEYRATPSYATTVPVKPTLVTDMPPLFMPRF